MTIVTIWASLQKNGFFSSLSQFLQKQQYLVHINWINVVACIPDIHLCAMPSMKLVVKFSIQSVNGNKVCLFFVMSLLMDNMTYIIPLYYCFCRGVDDPALWAGTVGNSWRTTDDINDTWARLKSWTLTFRWFIQHFIIV